VEDGEGEGQGVKGRRDENQRSFNVAIACLQRLPGWVQVQDFMIVSSIAGMESSTVPARVGSFAYAVGNFLGLNNTYGDVANTLDNGVWKHAYAVSISSTLRCEPSVQ
jgi:hypothetical protein